MSLAQPRPEASRRRAGYAPPSVASPRPAPETATRRPAEPPPRTPAAATGSWRAPPSFLEQCPKSFRIPGRDRTDDPIQPGTQSLHRRRGMRVHGLDLVVDVRALAHHG